MPKYLVQATYTAEGRKGLFKDKASGRKAAVATAMKAIGGKLESFYFTFGSEDAILIVDAPDNIAAAAISLTVGASGLVNLRTTHYSPSMKLIRPSNFRPSTAHRV